MRKFIVETDWWTDCDDAVAMRLLARAVKAKVIDVQGIIINACMEYSVASLDGFLSKEGVKNIPFAIDLNATDYGGIPRYQKRLAAYATRYKTNEEAEEPVAFFRKLLAQAKEPLELIELGYLQVFAALLESAPDEISTLNGVELVKEKVSKVWIMAGKWDKDGEKENNFARKERSRVAGEIVCRECPVPMTFLGWEAGNTVITGSKLDKNDWLYEALCDHGSVNGRASWDPMLMQLALIGDEQAAGYDTVCGTAKVDAETGQNFFKKDPNGLHRYVVKKYDDSYYENQIDELIKTPAD